MNLNMHYKGTLALGLLTAALVAMSSLIGTNVTAQGNSANESSSRDQISSWAYPPTHTSSAHIDSKRGAYIIDSATGEVWLVEGSGKPQKIGGVR